MNLKSSFKAFCDQNKFEVNEQQIEIINLLDKFINQALYSTKNGFYMKNNPFGAKGDFITSPNISILFSEMLCIWIVSFWQNLKCPKKINLIELGSGNGQMIYDMIVSFQNFPKFVKSCKFIILEKKLKWRM